MNQHLEVARKQYEKDGYDLWKLIEWHLAFGIVVSCESYFALGFHCSSEDPFSPVEPHHADTLFGTFCAGDLRSAIKPFVDKYEYIAFQRSFKGSDRVRLFCINDFYSKLK